jgi:hypothetical protein
MNENELMFKAGLGKGLRGNERNARNSQALIVSNGLIPEDGALVSVPALEIISGIELLGEVFPFPQVHDGQAHVVVMGQTKIWEFVDDAFVLVLSGLTPGGIWTVADFYDYIVMTNGKVMIKRDPVTHTWGLISDVLIPLGSCVCGVNGQLFIGSPEGGF